MTTKALKQNAGQNNINFTQDEILKQHRKSIQKFSVAKYSRKNLSRRKLRSFLTITSVGVCIVCFVLLSSLSQGIHHYVINEMEQFKEGRIEIYVYDGRTPLNESEIEDFRTIAADYCKQKGVSCTLNTRFVKLFTYERSEGFMGDYYFLMGVDLKEGVSWWLGNYHFTEKLKDGRHLNTIEPTENGVVLGYKVWSKFYSDKTVGDFIDIEPKNVSQYEWSVYPAELFPLENKDNITRESIRGIYNVKIIGILNKNFETDNFMYMPQKFLLQQFKQYDKVQGYFYSHLALVIDDARNIDFDDFEEHIADNFDRIDGSDNRWEVNFEVYQDIKNTLDGWLLILSIALILIILTGVSNTMTMSVLERKREIGILKAIGISKKGILKLILSEALLICGIALCFGLIIGGIISMYFDMNFDPENLSIFIAPAKITPSVIFSAISLSLGFGVLSSIYPAKKAFDLDPVEVFRVE